MADNIYDFKDYKEENQEEGSRKGTDDAQGGTDKKKLIIVALMIVLAAVLVFLATATLKGYTVKSETATENNTNVRYALFADGYIKYSNNGVEYQENIGTSVWDYAVSYSHPYLEMEDEYVLVMDRGKNKMTLFNRQGKVHEFTVKAPISSADLSANGHVLVMMDESDGKYIQIYDAEGKIIADMKASVDYSGYPMAAAISRDGEKVAISYFMISDIERKTKLAFFDLNPEVKSEKVKEIGNIEISNAIVPLLHFADDDRVAAIGDRETFIYNISKEPDCIASVKFDEEIRSIFFADKGMIYLTDNRTITNRDEEPEGSCGFYLISYDGDIRKHKAFDLSYEDIALHGSEIIALNGDTVTIIDDEGKIRFTCDIEGDALKELIPAGGKNNYYIVYKDRITKIHLSIFSNQKEKSEETNL